MSERADTLILNSSSLLTMKGPSRARAGREMMETGSIKDGAVAVKDGLIAAVGTTEEITERFRDRGEVIDAGGRVVMPGFVDCHTHLVYAGSRENEMAARLSGSSYLEILESGGGIHSTVQSVRGIADAELVDISRKRMDMMFYHGTTSAEIKSGYGLDYNSEKKILDTAILLGGSHPMSVVATFLGAHTVPKERSRGEYLRWIIEDALPAFSKSAYFCDVFCEQGAFTLNESREILEAASASGYRLKIHSGQFNDLGAAGMAALLGAVSADHLDRISVSDRALMAENGTIAVLLPGVNFFLFSEEYPDYAKFRDSGVPVAIATDFNPGSCPTFSMQMIISLACLKMRMSIEEALTAATINAAWAIDKGETAGSLEPGKKADIIALDISSPWQIPYHFGTNLVSMVMKDGKVFRQ